MVNLNLFSVFSELADKIQNDYFYGDVIVEIRLHDSKPRGGWGLKWKSGKTKDFIFFDISNAMVNNQNYFDKYSPGFENIVYSQAEYLKREYIESIKGDIDDLVNRIVGLAVELEEKYGISIDIKRSNSRTDLIAVSVDHRESGKINVSVMLRMFTNRGFHDKYWDRFERAFRDSVKIKAERDQKLSSLSKDGFKKLHTKQDIEEELFRIARNLGEFRGKKVVDLISSVGWFKSITTMGRCWTNGKIEINEVKLYIPMETVRSTLYHELAHLYESNHSKKFYDILLRWMPNYKEVHRKEGDMFRAVVRWMKENGIKGYGIPS